MAPAVPFAALHSLGVIMILTAVLSLAFNGCGLLVFLKTKSLRSPPNCFIMSLCMCDMLMAFVSFIPAVACFHRDTLLHSGLCVFEGFSVYFLGLTAMYLLAAISVVRYVIIAKPLLKSRITHRVAAVTITGCLGFGLVWSSVPLMGWNRYTIEGIGVSCSVLWQSDNIADTSYIIAIFIACLLIPVAVMVFSYFHVYMTIRHIRKHSTLDSCSRVKMRNFLLEKKMLKTCIIMVSVFLLSWLPYSITSLISAFGFPHLISPLMGAVPSMMAKTSGLWNPIIYIATNKQFRSAFYKLLPCHKKTPDIRAASEYETNGYTTHNISTTFNSVMPSTGQINQMLAVVEEIPRSPRSVKQELYDTASVRQGSPGREAATSKQCVETRLPRLVTALQNPHPDKMITNITLASPNNAEVLH